MHSSTREVDLLPVFGGVLLGGFAVALWAASFALAGAAPLDVWRYGPRAALDPSVVGVVLLAWVGLSALLAAGAGGRRAPQLFADVAHGVCVAFLPLCVAHGVLAIAVGVPPLRVVAQALWWCCWLWAGRSLGLRLRAVANLSGRRVWLLTVVALVAVAIPTLLAGVGLMAVV